MNIKMDGMDDLNKFFGNLEKKIKEQAEGSASFGELFNEDFMSQYTNAKTIGEFFQSGGFKIESPEDFKAIDDQDLNDYVAKSTQFENWKEMQQQAGTLLVKKRLNL